MVTTALEDGATAYAEDESPTSAADETESVDELPLEDEVLALVASPWLLGFQDSAAMTIDVVIGVIVAALAAFEVWLTREHAPRLTASQ